MDGLLLKQTPAEDEARADHERRRVALYVASFLLFVEREALRWTRPAARILRAEGAAAAAAWSRTLNADIAAGAVDEAAWREYMNRVWTTTVPTSGNRTADQLLITPQEGVFLGAAAVWLRDNGPARVEGIVATSREQIGRSIAEGVMANESVEGVASRIVKDRRAATPARARLIGGTEVHAAANYGALAAVTQAGPAIDKIWLTRGDARVRPAHATAHGQRRLVTDEFQIGGYAMQYPGDSSRGAPNSLTIGCRCVLGYESARRAPRRAA